MLISEHDMKGMLQQLLRSLVCLFLIIEHTRYPRGRLLSLYF
jgi:hypothetical protein